MALASVAAPSDAGNIAANEPRRKWRVVALLCAAELLGIPRPTLHAKLRKHGIRTTTVVENGTRPPGE